GRALVVDAERAAAAVQGAVVDDGDAGRGHALAHASGVGAGALAVEVALESVADRFVEQHARPAGAEHHRHVAGRRVHRLEVHQRLAQRLAGEGFRAAVSEQFLVGITPAIAGVAALAASVLLHDHLYVEPYQGAHVGGEHAVAARHQHRVHAAGQAHHHLAHARIGRAYRAVPAPPRLDLGRAVERVHRADRPRRARRFEQRLAVDVVRVGEAGLLAADRAHAHALLDRVRAVLDDPVLHAPALAPRMLEIDVAEVDAGPEQGAEHAIETGRVEPGRLQQARLGQGEGGWGGIHAASLGPGARSASPGPGPGRSVLAGYRPIPLHGGLRAVGMFDH